MPTGNMKTIKRRIKSVGSTMQITKAMEMVASSKLRRAKHSAEIITPYFETQYKILSEIANGTQSFDSVFAQKREIKNRLYIVIAGDRGLAGGYNSNIIKMVTQTHEGVPNPEIIAIGKKAVDYFVKRDYDVVAKYENFSENVKVAHCSDIANMVVNKFVLGHVDEVVIFFTAYISPLVQAPMKMVVFPLVGINEERGGVIPTTYDPSPEAVFNRVVKKFILSLVQCACVESYASEQSARRIAMESASDNAEEMIEHLSLIYNRARQEKITNEIGEIIAGANAI